MRNVSPKNNGIPPNPHNPSPIAFTTKVSDNAPQIPDIIPGAIKDFFVGSKTPYRAGSVIPITPIIVELNASLFNSLFFVFKATPKAEPATAAFPNPKIGKTTEYPTDAN